LENRGVFLFIPIFSLFIPQMAYIPLHHKYRPQTFADLVGQEAISTTLTNALRLQKIAPAYLFTGPRGTGKTSSARILAKSLNCMASQVPTAQPCGKCDVCNSIALGAALDIIEIDAASNTGVDNIREIIERAQYAPVQCRYKVYIIDECHMLTTAAFNSLLKTLEEPPLRVVFILATTDPQRVLPTIISRCQRFDYRRIPVDAMVGHLTDIAKTEQIEIAAASVKLIAQIAQGGLRDAESLLDRLSLLDGEITPDRVYDAIGSVPEQDLLDILHSIAKSDPESLLDRTRNILERGKEPLTVLQNLAGCYRDLLIAKTAPQRPDLVALTHETWTELGKIARTWELSWILAGQKHLKDSELQIKQTTQPQLWLEIALLGLLTVSTQHAPTTAIAALPPRSVPPQISASPTIQSDNAAKSLRDGDTNTKPSQSAIAAPKIAIDSQDLTSTWEQVLQQLLPASRDLFKPFGKLISISEAQAIVAMKSSTMQSIASGKVPELAKVFSHMCGRSIGVKLEVMGKSQPQPSLSQPSPPAPPPVPVEPSLPPTELKPLEPLPLESSLPPAATSIPAEYLIDEAKVDDRDDDIGVNALAEHRSLPLPEIDAISQPLVFTQPELDLAELPDTDPLLDFAEPPESMDIDRAANTSVVEPEELEIDPILQMATDNLVKIFDGEIIDRHHELFDRIVSN
jgi:DNA polymerase III subunit gamma/tau